MADTVQEIKEKLSLADVVGSYIELKKAGINFKARCPFHTEKTASLVVSPVKEVWHCFGCHMGGDMFSFVQQMERVEFFDALKILAEKAGVSLPESGGNRQDKQRQLLIKINTFAAKYYHKLLLSPQGDSARKYLITRGITEQTIQDWQIGFAPNEFHSLERALQQKSVSTRDMVAAGVSVAKDGKVYDRFRNRVTFPIYSTAGEVLGFSARTLDSGDIAKYINSSETLIYKKGEELFGVFAAKSAIREQHKVVVVEGQLDCIQSHQAGVKHVVATSGTAMTASQIRKLARLTQRVDLCFDADSAGHGATWQAARQALVQNFAVYIVTIPHGKDPDELILSSPKSWADALASAQPLFDWAIAKCSAIGSGSLPAKQYITEHVLPALKLVSDPITQDHYLQLFAQQIGITVGALKQALSQAAETSSVVLQEASQSTPLVNESLRILELLILGQALIDTEKLASLLDVGVTAFKDPELRDLAEQMAINLEVARVTPLAEEARFVVESENQTSPGSRRDFEKTFYIWLTTAIKQQIADISAKLRAFENSGGSTPPQELTDSLVRLLEKRNNFEQRLIAL